MDDRSPRHETALEYARSGIPVFPCRVDGKEPACPHGHKDATTDEAQIDAWWAEADYNLAVSPADAGWSVIDIDPGADTSALDLPHTYTVTTPRGGLHLYYEGSLPTTASRLAPNIDTRGVGGYVLVPPSIVGGKPYVAQNELAIAPLPGWIETSLRARSQELPAAVRDLDLPGNVDRAKFLLNDLVGRGDVAVSGRGGNDRTYRLACELSNLGLSLEKSRELLEDIWNPACQPPWDRTELDTILFNAAHYTQNEVGSYGVAPAAEVFGHALDQLALTTETPARSRFHMEDEDEQDQGSDPRWLVADAVPSASTVLMVGATQSYKSFLALDIALSVAAHVDTFGSLPSEEGPVFYAALEGRANIKKARRKAWRIARGITGTIQNFFVGPAPFVYDTDQLNEFGEEIKRRCAGRKPTLIVIDTLSKAMAGLNENDARDAGQFIRFCDALVEGFGCSVLAIHHTGKDDARGARGSSAFHAGFDTVLEVKAHRATKAVEVWVRKHKDAEEKETPFCFEGKTVGNSLVFQPIDKKAYDALKPDEDIYAAKKIGAALKSLNAFGLDAAVTSIVLATKIMPELENESPEDRQKSINRAVRVLASLSRTKLVAYCERRDKELLWHLPAPS